MPHGLLLSTSLGERSVLLPAVPPIRPTINAAPFSSEIVLDRLNEEWKADLDSSTFLIPIHNSLSFLVPSTLSSALYLLVCRFQARAYDSAVRLIDCVATDTPMTKEQNSMLNVLASTHDMHPDAIACRLKVTAALSVGAGFKPPWNVSQQAAAYVSALSAVSATCRLSQAEALTILDSGLCIADPDDPKYVALKDKASLPLAAICSLFNWRLSLRQPPGVDIPRVAYAERRLNPSALINQEAPNDGQWARDWHDHVLKPNVDAEILSLAPKLSGFQYLHNRSLLDYEIVTLVGQINARAGGKALLSGGFMHVYALLCGATTTDGKCGASLGSMLATLMCHVEGEASILTSILLTLAHRPQLALYCPPPPPSFLSNGVRLTPLAIKKQQAEFTTFLTSLSRELKSVGTDVDLTKRMVARRVEAMASVESSNERSGGWLGSGWRFGSHKSRQEKKKTASTMEEMQAAAREAEAKCTAELQALARFREELSVPSTEPADPQAFPPFAHSANHVGPPCVLDNARRQAELREVRATPAATMAQLEELASSPLNVIGLSDFVAYTTRAELGLQPLAAELPLHDLTSHPEHRSKVSRAITQRLKADAAWHAENFNSSRAAVLTFLPPDLMTNPRSQQTAVAMLADLLGRLHGQRDVDAAFVRQGLLAIDDEANNIFMPEDASPSVQRSTEHHFLRQSAAISPPMPAEHLLQALASSLGAAEIQRVNPYANDAAATLDQLTAVVLHASRQASINRAIVEAKGMHDLLTDEGAIDANAV